MKRIENAITRMERHHASGDVAVSESSAAVAEDSTICVAAAPSSSSVSVVADQVTKDVDKHRRSVRSRLRTETKRENLKKIASSNKAL